MISLLISAQDSQTTTNATVGTLAGFLALLLVVNLVAVLIFVIRKRRTSKNDRISYHTDGKNSFTTTIHEKFELKPNDVYVTSSIRNL